MSATQSPSKPVCYDKLGYPVHVGDTVLASDQGNLMKVRVERLVMRVYKGPRRTSAYLHITWLEDASCGTLPDWKQHFTPTAGRLKLTMTNMEPDGLLTVHRILKI